VLVHGRHGVIAVANAVVVCRLVHLKSLHLVLARVLLAWAQMVKRKPNRVTPKSVQRIVWVNGQRGVSAVNHVVAVPRAVRSPFPSLLLARVKHALPKIVRWTHKRATRMHARLIVLALGQPGVTAVSNAVVVKVFVCLLFTQPRKVLVKIVNAPSIKLKLKNATLMHVL